MINFLICFGQLLLKRIKSKSPKFYKQLRYLSGVLVIFCVFILLSLHVEYFINFFKITIKVKENISWVADHLGALLSGIWLVSWTGTVDSNLIDNFFKNKN